MNMVERVALAIGLARDAWVRDPDTDLDSLDLMLARAAIEAMREPNGAMLRAGGDIYDLSPSDAEKAYCAMIYAALAESDPPQPTQPPAEA